MVEESETSGPEQSKKNDAIESHERELFDKNLPFEYQLFTVRVQKERHEARDKESTKTATDAKDELANTKKATRVV